MYLLIYLIDTEKGYKTFNLFEDMNKWIKYVKKKTENEGCYFKVIKKYKIEKEID